MFALKLFTLWLQYLKNFAIVKSYELNDMDNIIVIIKPRVSKLNGFN